MKTVFMGWLVAIGMLAPGRPAAAASANLLPDGGFESGRLKTAMRDGGAKAELAQEAGIGGRWALRLPRGAVSQCVFRLPVQAGRRYRLRFMGKVEGPGAIAADMAADAEHAMQRLGATRGLAEWRIQFEDRNGRAMKLPARFGMKIIHAMWTEYREDFYAPAGAASLKLSFSNGTVENTAWIDDICLTPLEGKALNLNPEISLGAYNFSGYNLFHNYSRYDPAVKAVRIILAPDKDGYLDCACGYVLGDPFPARAGTYRLSFRARRHGPERASMAVWYYDQAGHRAVTAPILVGGEPWRDYDYPLTLPDKAVSARLVFGGGDFDWMRFEPSPANAQTGRASE
jgi:hypothetical protein